VILVKVLTESVNNCEAVLTSSIFGGIVKLKALYAAALVLCLGVPLTASSIPDATAERRGADAKIVKVTDPATLALAEANGVDPATATMQIDKHGAQIVSDADGDYILQIPTEEVKGKKVKNDGIALAASWAIGLCSGSGIDMHILNNTIVWGATNSCASSTSVYPHYLDVTLRSTCSAGWPLCGVFYPEVGPIRSNNSWGSVVANVYMQSWCDTTENYTFDQYIKVTVRGTQYGPFSVPAGGKTLPCNVTA
jgi:hypothetical protein